MTESDLSARKKIFLSFFETVHFAPQTTEKIQNKIFSSRKATFSHFIENFFRFLWPRYSSSICRMTEYLLLTTNNEILVPWSTSQGTRDRVILEWRLTRDGGFSLGTSASGMNSDADMKSLEVSLYQKKADRGQLMVKNEILPRGFRQNSLF